MEKCHSDQDRLAEFVRHLKREERALKTIEKYRHDVAFFLRWANGRALHKELVAQWKEFLVGSGRSAGTVNGALAALHSYLGMLGRSDCRVKYLKLQRRMFRDAARDLSQGEYLRLVQAAHRQGKERVALLMEAICATGVRVSEVRYLTVEAARNGRAVISLKGKIRTILIPGKLAKKLLQYAQKQKIAHGEIFLAASGNRVNRRQIWGEMKKLCQGTGVNPTKVFPHNLRHLFARSYYKVCRDIVKLADVLGHSSIETTRIYLIATGAEHVRQLERLGLIL